jgi:hypothetical protein
VSACCRYSPNIFKAEYDRSTDALIVGVDSKKADNCATSGKAIFRFEAIKYLSRSEILLCKYCGMTRSWGGSVCVHLSFWIFVYSTPSSPTASGLFSSGQASVAGQMLPEWRLDTGFVEFATYTVWGKRPRWVDLSSSVESHCKPEAVHSVPVWRNSAREIISVQVLAARR